MSARGTLVIACGALAREIAALRRANQLEHARRALPAGGVAQPARAHRAGGARGDARATRSLRRDPRRLRGVRHRRCSSTRTRRGRYRAAAGRALLRILRHPAGVRAAVRGRAGHLLPHRLPPAALRAPGRALARARPPPRARRRILPALQEARVSRAVRDPRQRRPRRARSPPPSASPSSTALPVTASSARACAP